MKALLSYKFRKKNLRLLIFLTDYIIEPFWDIIVFLSRIKGLRWLDNMLIQDIYWRHGFGSIRGYWYNSFFLDDIRRIIRNFVDWFIKTFLRPWYQNKITRWFIYYSDSKFLWDDAFSYKVRNRERDVRYFNLFVIPWTNYFKLTMMRYVDTNTSEGLNMYLHSFIHMNDTKEEYESTYKKEEKILFKGFIWNKKQLLRFMKAYRFNYGKIYTYKQRYESRLAVKSWLEQDKNTYGEDS